ncbi:MAG: hypothetical protein IKZ58_06965 [Selenomonadaceae bacterium]|nr:hypothetical protein [Selenomonadaceae bacterium]
MKNFESKFENISWQIILILFSGIFFIINILTPFIADDITYAFIWDGENVNVSNEFQRIESFTDILISQWSHYFTWGGRTIAHIIVQFFAWVGKIYFNVLNVFVFCVAVLLIFKIGTGLNLRDMNKKFLLFILFGMYLLTPDFVFTEVWMTGAINYLWMTTLELLFLLPFALKYHNKNFWINPPKWSLPAMVVTGLIAGWSIEPGASITMLVTFLFVITFWREKSLQSWMTIGFIFLTLGFLLLIFAPGNMERLLTANIINTSYNSLEAIIFKFKTGFLPILLRESILFLPILYYLFHKRQIDNTTKFIVTFMAASIIILFVMLFIPFFPERAGFPATIFLLISSTAALKEILPDVEKIYKHNRFFKFATKILIVLSIFHLSACTYVYAVMYMQLQERWEVINANRNAEEIIVSRLVLPSWSEDIVGNRTWTNLIIFGDADISPQFEGGRNRIFAQYYGLKKIRIAENL